MFAHALNGLIPLLHPKLKLLRGQNFAIDVGVELGQKNRQVGSIIVVFLCASGLELE